MRLTPIIAVVDPDTLLAVEERAARIALVLADNHELRRLMDRNGWTFESMAAGRLIGDAIRATYQIDRREPEETNNTTQQQEDI